MYYYNSAGQQIQAKSFNPIAENYIYRSGEKDDNQGGGRGMGLFVIVVLILLVGFLLTRYRKNTLKFGSGSRFVF
jgi:hypothetical protein